MTSARKPSAGFWITVALVTVLVGYPLSVGPGCWMTATPRTGALVGHHKAMIAFWPLGRAATWNAPIGRVLQWWMRLGTPAGRIAMVPTNPSGTNVIGFGTAVK
jgi:hypothetical protein